jgi:hypothetical protein
MNQSFVPKAKGLSPTDDRELGLMVYHLYVGEADKLGTVPGVVDATPVSLPPLAAAPAAGTTGTAAGAKAAPGAKASPAARGASPVASPKASPAAKASAAPKK